MREDEQRRLVAALAELLADWLTAHPERLPSSLRSGRECGLVDVPHAEEQP
jgi:hypothetical protein